MDETEDGAVVLFDGNDLRVKFVPAKSTDIVVTFTGRAAKPPVPKGFGEDFFRKRGVSAIHFISKANHWWQTAEIGEAIEAVKRSQAFTTHRRVTVYGSSMGGFASLMHSRSLDVDQLIVVSPQYSINQKVVPFEKRWQNYAEKLTFDYDDMTSGLHPSAPLWAIVDPHFTPDVQHIRMVEQLRPVNRIEVPFAGHNTARVLEEAGLMQRMLTDLVSGDFDSRDFRSGYRRKRVESSLFWFGLAEALIARGREAWAAPAAAIAAELILKGARMRDPSLRVEMLRLAFRTAVDRGDRERAAKWLSALREADPKHAMTALAEASMARLDGDDDGALAAAQRAHKLRPKDGNVVAALINELLANGDAAGALRFAERAGAAHRRVGIVQLAVARTQLALDDQEAARETLQAAQRRGASAPTVRILLAEDLLNRRHADAARRQLKPVLAKAVINRNDRSAARDLARRLGWKQEAQGFMSRCGRADKLYARTAALLQTIDPAGPGASVPTFLARLLGSLANPLPPKPN